MSTNPLRRLSASAFRLLASSALLASAVACSAPSNDDMVTGDVDVIQTSQAALGIDLSSMTLEGTYGASCSGHSSDGTDPWTSADLAVRRNDAACVLSITAIVVNGTAYRASSSLPLDEGNTFAHPARAYAAADQDIAFYANAKIDTLGFDEDFTITVVTSAPSRTGNASRDADYATQGVSLEAGTVPAPSYEVSFEELHIAKDVNNVVVPNGVSGYAAVPPFGAADRFAVRSGEVAPYSFETVDEAFGEGDALPSDGHIPASHFAGLAGSDLDDHPVWTLMFRSSGANGVHSYQLVYVTFTP